MPDEHTLPVVVNDALALAGSDSPSSTEDDGADSNDDMTTREFIRTLLSRRAAAGTTGGDGNGNANGGGGLLGTAAWLPDPDMTEQQIYELYRRRRIGRSARRGRPSRRAMPGRVVSGAALGKTNVINFQAKFFIGQNKSKATIRFTPPITGRYILLKLFSPSGDGESDNIDVQHVAAYGFSGARFVPGLEFR